MNMNMNMNINMKDLNCMDKHLRKNALGITWESGT